MYLPFSAAGAMLLADRPNFMRYRGWGTFLSTGRNTDPNTDPTSYHHNGGAYELIDHLNYLNRGPGWGSRQSWIIKALHSLVEGCPGPSL